MQPTIISKIKEKKENNQKSEKNISSYKEKRQVFKKSTSEELKKGLREVLNNNPEISNSANIPEVKLGAKS